MKRVFISYRSSDGKKDASRLAEDLQEIFGEQAVFYDKHDLHGGSSWREQVQRTLGSRPVVLVLLTADYFGAKEDGELRIHRNDDPVRQELLAAFDTQATVLPLLTEGVTMPRPAALPADLVRVTEAHALRLRTEDWRADLARLVKDLQALGVTPQDPEVLARRGFYGGGTGGSSPSGRGGYKWLGWAVGLTLLCAAVANQPDNDHDTRVGLAALGLLPVWLAWRGRTLLKPVQGTAPKVWSWAALGWAGLICIGLMAQVANPPHGEAQAETATPAFTPTAPAHTSQPVAQVTPTTPSPVAPGDNLTGAWLATMANGTQLPFTLLHRGEQVLVTTTKLDVRNDASFAAMNQYLARTQGFMVQDIRVRGQGRVQDGTMELAMLMTDGDGQRTLDQGNMTLAVADAGRTLAGSVHFASGTPTPIRFSRQ